MDNYVVNISKKFDSEKKAIHNIEPIINEIKEKVDINLEKYYNILIAVTEAFNNAIIHGNKLDKNKKVRLDIQANSQRMEVHVFDEGTGFNPKELADPRAPENLLKESGRGVLLINELSDECEFKTYPDGSEVFMVFKLS